MNTLSHILEGIHEWWRTEQFIPVQSTCEVADADSRKLLFSSLDAFYLEVSAAQDALRLITSHVAYRRNMMVKINLLPVEILGKIFVEASQGELLESTNISHACSHWRDISLSIPALWSIIDFGNFDLNRCSRNIKLFAKTLERTRGYPLTWRGTSEDDSMEEQLCIKHLCHIDTLQLNTSFGGITTKDDHWLRYKEAPLLRHFTLRDVTWSDNIWPRLFEQGAPALTSLRISGSRLPWASGYYNDLTVLHIDEVDILDPADNDFLDAMRDCPNLRELSLEHVVFPIRKTLTAVPLPHLHKLNLKLEPDYLFHIWNSISTSPGMPLMQDIEGFDDNSVPLSKRVPTSYFDTIICEASRGTIQLYAGPFPGCVDMLPANFLDATAAAEESGLSHINIDVCLGELHVENDIHFISHLKDHLPVMLDYLSIEVDIDMDRELSVPAYIPVLRKASSVTRLQVSWAWHPGKEEIRFWDVFEEDLISDSYFLPHVTSLILKSVLMNDNSNPGQILRVIETWQSRTGSHLRKLYLIDCVFTSKDTEEIIREWLKHRVDMVELKHSRYYP